MNPSETHLRILVIGADRVLEGSPLDIVKAWQEGKRHAELWENAHTVAAGIRVPAAVGDFLIIDAVRESDGFGATVNDDEIIAAGEEVSQKEGFLMCPEGAATYAAYKQALDNGTVSPDESAVLFNCATGLKYDLPRADAKRGDN